MKIEKLIKIVKAMKWLTILLPIILAIIGIAGRISVAGKGDPGGDPIDDDPVPT